MQGRAPMCSVHPVLCAGSGPLASRCLAEPSGCDFRAFAVSIASRSVNVNHRTSHRPATQRSARSWTGRSALSCATASARSRYETAGTHRTRVSEMRLATARIGRLSRRGETAGAVCSAFQHRMSSRPASSEATT